ncbi:class I SAM-dependent methyltransferase [Actinoplanes sp. TBRC 11911]|uniref:class I SAM-dependent methyltransferase n=1 Tax=Actinoplanes sp. TBRC 11911 TaxID=2729386 RepID=UPI00145C7FBD|nr:class I SAM-dependent methyltransferase [Actinoplanes sp. TBRC 11911]NMO56373.1 class I SAM-dependent methyltransferase [Actinoplanes sp. TBRC 11911]
MSPSFQTVRQSYASLAALYIDMFGATSQVDADDLALIGRHLTGTVVDAGCGPGHLTAYLRSLGVSASGIDLVPEFIAHARATHPDVPFHIGSMDDVEGPVDGILSWYSLIHRPPHELDGVLARFRRVLKPGGTLVVGFFDGDEVVPFPHKVTTAYFWPVDEFAARLVKAGFTEVERQRRPTDGPRRAHAAIAAR